MQGGLYPGGSNAMPPMHRRLGEELALGIVPRNVDGEPSDEGPIVFVGMGMSNAGTYFRAFRERIRSLPALHERVLLVDATLEGPDITAITESEASYWRFVRHRVEAAGCSVNQVQAAWFMQAVLASNIRDETPLEHVTRLEGMILSVLGSMNGMFPQLRQVCSAGREFGGYATSGGGNPEPYAWCTGWAWKRLIQRQIEGDSALACTVTKPSMPWLGWSGYFWANGAQPRRDGLCWLFPEDFEPDGVHPSSRGAEKASSILLDFYRNDPVNAWLWGKGRPKPP